MAAPISFVMLSSNKDAKGYKDANPSFSVINVISLEWFYHTSLCSVLMATWLWDGIPRQKTLLEETFACGKEVKLNKCAGRAKHTLSKKRLYCPSILGFCWEILLRYIETQETKRKMDDPSVPIWNEVGWNICIEKSSLNVLRTLLHYHK